MENRYYKARENIIDLIQSYGKRAITVKITQDGEEIKVLPRYFVSRQLKKAGITVPYCGGAKKISKIINPTLDDDMLSVIFHRAVFELEEAYIEEFCQGKPQAQAFIESVNDRIKNKRQWLSCTFPAYKDEELLAFLDPEITKGYFSAGLEVTEEDAKTLSDMGYDEISNTEEMKELFWDFAVRREPIGRLMKNAILAITLDEQAANYLSRNFRDLNRIIQEHIDSGAAKPTPKATDVNLPKDIQQEIMQVRREANKKVKAAKKEVMEDLRYLQKLRKLAKKLKRLLLDPRSPLVQIIDFTKEEDINSFLNWFKYMERHVPPTFVRQLEKRNYEEGQLDLFKQKVEAHNAKFPVGTPDDDSDDDVEEIIEE